MEIKHEVISKPRYGSDIDVCTFYLLENNNWVAFGNGTINKKSGLMSITVCTYTPAKLELEAYVRNCNE